MARKQNTPTQQNTMIMSTDFGFGLSKILAMINGKTERLLFPSVFSHAIEARFSTEATRQKYAGDTLFENGTAYFMGSYAQKHANPANLRNIIGDSAQSDAYNIEVRLRFFKYAISKLFPNKRDGEIVHVHLTTGLPAGSMSNAEIMKTAFLDQHAITTDTTNFIANVVSVAVMPQPYGVIYSSMFNDNGDFNRSHSYSRTGSVDIGTYTTDVALDDDGEYIDALSGTVRAGVDTIRQRVAIDYYDRYRATPSYETIESIVRNKSAKIDGIPTDFSQVVNAGIAELQDATLTLVTQKWGPARDIECIFVAGGGSSMVFPVLRQQYPQAVLLDDAQFKIVQGYHNWSLNRRIYAQ